MKTIADLRAALDYPAGPTDPNTSAIITRGRRSRTTRRVINGAGLLAITAAAAIGVGAVTSPDGTRGTPDASGRAAVTPSNPPISLSGRAPNMLLVAAVLNANQVAPSAPEQFDPLTRTLHVDWIPAGLINESATITRDEQIYSAFDASRVNGGPDVGLVVDVLAKGRPVDSLPGGALGLPMNPVIKPTQSINGGPAECLSDPMITGSCGAIRWQYAPGVWARVSYRGTAGHTPSETAAVARKVAESVRLTDGEPVRLPFSLSGKLDGLRPIRSFVDVYAGDATGAIAGERWDASVDLAIGGAATSSSTTVHSVTVELLQRPNDPSGRIYKDSPGNTTIDGHQAWLRSDRSALVVWGVSRSRLAIEYQNGVGDARQAYSDVHVMANPDNSAGWPALR